MKTEKYNMENKKNETNKIEANRLFTRYAIQNMGNALILDAEDLRTTTWLNRRGFNNIFVPNPYIFNLIKSDKRITAINSFVGNLISHTFNRFTAVWLDYCCSFDGNSDMKPQEDIKNLFKRKLLQDNSTFAVTFCFRKSTPVEYTCQDEDRVRTCIENEARINGYVAVTQRTMKYKGMFFIIYKVFNQ